MIFSEPKGIKLEISLSERILIPPKEESQRIEISLHLTNLTSTPWRFDFYRAMKLYPELRDAGGQEYERIWARRRVNKILPADFPVVKPGEKTTFLRTGEVVHSAKSSYNQPELFRLWLWARCGLFWQFRPHLRPGKYQIRYTYHNDKAKLELGEKTARLWRKQGEEPVLEDFWTGTVSTPFVFFDLVSETES